MLLPTHRVSLSPSTKDKGFSEMLQQVARLVRLGSFAAAYPHYGDLRFKDTPWCYAMILNDYNTLNPGIFRLWECLSWLSYQKPLDFLRNRPRTLGFAREARCGA